MLGLIRGEKEFTGRHMLMMMLCFFGVVIAVNLTLAYFALGSWTGLVVKNSYVASQQFNGWLEDAERQKALGWQSGLDHADGEVIFTLTNADGKGLEGFSVEALTQRPSYEAEDRTMKLLPLGAGRYRAESALAPGLWLITVSAGDTAGRSYKKVFRLYMPDEGRE